MLALIAMIVFILGLFKVTIGGLDMTLIGLAFLAAHFALSGGLGWYEWPGRRTP